MVGHCVLSFGLVKLSTKPPFVLRDRVVITVANDDGVNQQRQQGSLILGGIVLEESFDVVIANGHI